MKKLHRHHCMHAKCIRASLSQSLSIYIFVSIYAIWYCNLLLNIHRIKILVLFVSTCIVNIPIYRAVARLHLICPVHILPICKTSRARTATCASAQIYCGMLKKMWHQVDECVELPAVIVTRSTFPNVCVSYSFITRFFFQSCAYSSVEHRPSVPS